MTDTKKTAADRDRIAGTEPQGPNKRLKKDGTPDGRANNSGKKGNRGNKQATGRKKIASYEARQNFAYVATDKEHKLLKEFNQILRTRPDVAQKIQSKLGTPPTGRASKKDRKNRSVRCTQAEKEQLKRALATIKDRYLLAYDVIAEQKEKM
jgi:hypothetical protein